MGKRTVIPFGPQHPVLPEPIHLDLVLEDETVVDAIPSIGFVHRGLEKLVEKREYTEFVYVAERICGICSFMHGMGYCMAVEHVMDVEIPDRAVFLRTIWAELSRLQSHLLWLGLQADAMGFDSLFMHSWRLREEVLDIFDMTTGGRLIHSVCKIGGVRKNMDKDTLKRVLDKLDVLESELSDITGVFLNDSSVHHRLSGLGVLTKEEAHALGAVGPMARASGINMDMRRVAGYGIYPELKFDTPLETAGDCWARTSVRISDMFESFKIIRQCVDMIPDDEVIEVKVKGMPEGEYFARLEQPRGEALYYIKGNGTKFLDRMRVRTPTFANVPSLIQTLKGVQLADVPMLILTIDPCISCTER